jgi:sortase A
VLTGHSAAGHARIFTDLEKLEMDDIFLIHVLTETLAYQVDSIQVVTPDNTDDLYPVPGEDYITLVTCTPYGINSHRLLVRGTRIPYQPDMFMDDGYVVLVAPYLLFIGLVLVGGVVLVVYHNQKKRRLQVTVV